MSGGNGTITGYEKINRIMKERMATGENVHVEDLLAMDESNDPFYCGTPGNLIAAEWFAELWEKHGFGQGTHIRRIHYAILGPDTKRPNGSPYRNTSANWAFLNRAARQARYLGMVDPLAFSDHRNPDPVVIIHRPEYPETPDVELEEAPPWKLPRISTALPPVGFFLPEPVVTGYEYDISDQPYHLEAWIEKSSVDDVLEPVCRELGINLVTGKGYQSITSIIAMAKRIAESGKPGRVLYISDFDPSGDKMPRHVARHLEFWLKKYAPEAEAKLESIALTLDQVVKFQLPREPIKPSDKGKGGFEERYGEGATELDALEARHPGEMAKILREAAASYFDPDLEDQVIKRREMAEETILREWRDLTADSRTEAKSISREAEGILGKYREQLSLIDQDLQEELGLLKHRLETAQEVVWQATREAPEYLRHVLPCRPEPETDPPDESTWYFDSARDYLTQLEAYKARENGKATNPEAN